jgi:Ni/Co efflux regulator RcnB
MYWWYLYTFVLVVFAGLFALAFLTISATVPVSVHVAGRPLLVVICSAAISAILSRLLIVYIRLRLRAAADNSRGKGSTNLRMDALPPDGSGTTLTRCGRCGAVVPWYDLRSGTCERCADEIRMLSRLEVEDYQRSQAWERGQALNQSYCRHEFEATPYLRNPSDSYARPTSLRTGNAMTFAEDFYWSGQCVHCGIEMRRIEQDTCKHHWVEDYHTRKFPQSQCSFCGAFKPGVQERINRILTTSVA